MLASSKVRIHHDAYSDTTNRTTLACITGMMFIAVRELTQPARVHEGRCGVTFEFVPPIEMGKFAELPASGVT